MKYFVELRCPPGYKYDPKTKSCVPKYPNRMRGYKNYGFYGRPSVNGNGKKTNGNGNGNGNGTKANGGNGGGNGGNGGGNGSGGNGGGGNGG